MCTIVAFTYVTSLGVSQSHEQSKENIGKMFMFCKGPLCSLLSTASRTALHPSDTVTLLLKAPASVGHIQGKPSDAPAKRMAGFICVS